MAQHYSRAPPSKGRVPMNEDWQPTPHSSHRNAAYAPNQSIQPSSIGPGGSIEPGGPGRGGNVGAIPVGAARLDEILNAVRQEFDGVVHEHSVLKNQREDFEAQAVKQINELTQIKNAVQELESVHHKARQAYEDELTKLRAEILALRAQVAAAAPANVPGSSQLGLSLPAVNAQGPPVSVIERGYGGEPYDRGGDLPPTKRIKSRDERDSPSRTPRVDDPTTSPYEFPGSLSPSSLPSALRKEGPDWFAMYNPRLPGGQKSLDITLLHQFNHESVVCCVRFSKDGRFLATGCNRSAQIFDMRSGALVCRLEDESVKGEGDLYIRSVCFSPDGKYLATGAEDRQIRIWDIKSRKIRHLFEGHEQEIYSLDFSSTGHLIVSGSGDKTARIWNMDNGTSTVLSISDPAQPPSAGAANTSTSSSGSVIVPGGNGVKEGDGDTAMTEAAVGSDAGVTSVAISPDGRLVAAGSLDTIVRLWDVATGTLLERLRGHRDSVYSVAFTPDGRGLVSGSLDKTLKYWELNSSALRNLAENGPKSLSGGEKYAKCQFNFVGHKDYVLSVAISHDGQWVVSGSKDRGVQFWDKNGVAQLMLQGHKNSVISIDLSPTGGHLATGSGDWQARVWGYTPLQPSRD